MSSENDIKADMVPSIADATRVWWKIGILSFGGPAAQIALMHKEVVDDRKWLSEQQFLNALSFCMLLPGPEAMQLATYAGWRLHGTIGGLIAGLLFVIPGAAVIMALAAIYSIYGNVPLVDALFYGIRAAVLVIVVEALLRVSKKALGQAQHWVIAGVAFVLGGLNLTTRDYARMGQMFLQNGRYNGQQIVPADWVAASTAPSAPTAEGQIGYGYQWWIPQGATEGEFMARGVYGQYIYINRADGVVIATNAADRKFREAGVSDQNIAIFRQISAALGGT